MKDMKVMTAEEKKWSVVAMMAGKATIIEAILQAVSKEAGFPVNWGYIGGTAYVHSQGDRVKVRSLIALAIPQTDIQESEKFAIFEEKEKVGE